MAIPLKKDPDVHVALAMGSTFGVAAEEVGGGNSEIRTLLEVISQRGFQGLRRDHVFSLTQARSLLRSRLGGPMALDQPSFGIPPVC
jgi:hypothetical protein